MISSELKKYTTYLTIAEIFGWSLEECKNIKYRELYFIKEYINKKNRAMKKARRKNKHGRANH